MNRLVLSLVVLLSAVATLTAEEPKPLSGAKSQRRIENFTRVETFGNPDAHWLRVTADPLRALAVMVRDRVR